MADLSSDTDTALPKTGSAYISKLPRIPIRLQWMMIFGVAVSLAVLLLTMMILDFERDAWLESQSSQAKILVERLAEELKIPVLSGSSAEVDKIIHSFLADVPAVMGVQFLFHNGRTQNYGNTGLGKNAKPAEKTGSSDAVQRIPFKHLWYGRKIVYSKSRTLVGSVTVRFSEEAWKKLAAKLVKRMLMAALLVIILFSLVVYWIAGRMSKPLESLAQAARQVARGNFNIRLQVKGNDEISDAVNQFNEMAKELTHKKELREAFSRYLNPKLIEGIFSNGSFEAKSTSRIITVLFADMVGFTKFAAVTPPPDVVETLDKYFELFHHIINFFDGHVDKYIGDALMAVFNHPKADSEHLSKAVMSALAMSEACKKLGINNHTGAPVEFRFGINCGEAIIGNLGAAERLEYTVIGDVVNVASRMTGVGHGGEVILSHSAFAKLSEGFAFHSLGSREISGILQRIECGKITSSTKKGRQLIRQAVDHAFDLGMLETQDML